MERPSGRRHVATARRPDVNRSYQPSGRPRCGHLVHSDARPQAFPRRARIHVGHHGGAGDRRDVDPNVWTRAHTELIRGAARIRRSNASSSTRRSRRRCAARPVAIAPGSPRCGRGRARLSFPRPHILSAGQSAMRAAAAAAVGRRLRSRSRSVVHGRNVASTAAVHRAGEAGARAYDGKVAARLPPSFDGAVRTLSAIGTPAAVKAPSDQTARAARRRRSASARRRSRRSPL